MATSRPGNLERYSQVDVVAHYASAEGLQPCERLIFDRHLTPGGAILDLGVGGGRTTPHLASAAGRYVGADYSTAMVEICKLRWPQLDFRWCDATDMSQFGPAEFDVVVFSFNGIDYIDHDDARRRCLSEVARILKSGGVFIFSSHNARQLGIWPQLEGARLHQQLWRSVRAVGKSLSIALRRITSGAFGRGEGYVMDPVHGGLRTFVSTPHTVRLDLARAGLELLETVHGDYPAVQSAYFAPWYYYVCRKNG